MELGQWLDRSVSHLDYILHRHVSAGRPTPAVHVASGLGRSIVVDVL